MADKKRMALGSGRIYIMTYMGTLPTDEALEIEDNILGNVSGGASLKYTPTFQTVEDDLGLVKETFLTKEEAVLKSGLLTWNVNTLKKLISTGRVTETGEPVTKRTLKIGGIENFVNESYVIRFVHKNNKNGDLRVTIVGKNDAGFELNFNPDNPTVINAEFKALPNDSTGTLIILDEEVK